jgi:hypothetical protein
MPPKVPALPRNEIEPRLSITGLSVQDIRALLRAGECFALESRNQKVEFLYDFARSECPTSLPAAIIGHVFEIHEVTFGKFDRKFCSAHCSDEVLGKLGMCGILVITYPPHTSHIFQVLDVLLLGILKKAKRYQRHDDTLRREVDHVLRLFRAYEQATTSATIRVLWLKTGFDYETRDAATYLIVNENKIRQGDGFREVWLFDCHTPRISKKMASQRWGWTNKHLFRKTEKDF